MRQKVQWEPHDPAWLVRLAVEQLPREPQISGALRQCRRRRKRSIAYWYFVDSTRPNQPGSEWQFARNIELDGGELGPLILDVLKDGRIGGVEFLNQIANIA